MQHYTTDPLEEPMRNRDYKDYKHIGRDVSRTIRHAIRSGNFEEASRALENGLQEFTNDVNGTIRHLKNAGQRAFYTQNQPRTDQNDAGGYQPQYAEARSAYQKSGVPSAFRRQMPGSISGLFCALFGFLFGIPLLIADMAVIAASAAGYMSFRTGVAGTIIMACFAAFSFAIAGYGLSLRRRARRFVRYRDALDGAAFCMIDQLAETVGEPLGRAKKDLKRMIVSGACPQGHLDHKETCFMVDDETYEEYLEVEKAYAAREAAAQAEKQKEQTDPEGAARVSVQKEGSAYLQQIRAVNDSLQGEEISKKLGQLETVTARIFSCVEQHPEKLSEIRHFMRYYMPTTLKLLKAYQEFDTQSVQGANITKAKQEINQALDTINTAFGNLLDTLYENDAFDISTDISTLETMLKQEGLTGSDFATKPDDSKPS